VNAPQGENRKAIAQMGRTGRAYIATASRTWLVLALAPGLLVVVGLVAYPLGLAVSTSLGQPPSLARYRAFLTDPSTFWALLNTLALAFATTLGSIALSIPLGYLARASSRLATPIRLLVTVPLAVPVLIAAYALTLFFSENGLFNNVLVRVLHVLPAPLPISYTWSGLVLACVWRFFPYTGLLVISALASVDRNLEDAAASTGAGPAEVLRRVTLPLIAPAALTGGILTFVSTFGTFSIPLIMGRSTEVLSVIAYRKATGSFDWAGASTIVIIMAVFQIATLVGLRGAVTRWTSR
jgi:ABC-type spermidine/putrescine transport system permease subunit I